MQSDNFIDYIRIFCKSGKGGAGASHFLREKFRPNGGPDGGDGGRGGHIILRGNKNMWTLLHLRYHKNLLAEDGKRGSKNNSSGSFGKDIYIEVPLGTVGKNELTGEVEAEILEHGQEVIWVKGGRGGLGNGNGNFATSTNQAPDYAQPGEPGIEEWKIVELKILADVGLVGFPNAGKSTLLSVISAAKPKIADYAFTTISPNLGIVEYKGGKSFCVADLPGIIEGASDGKGLGHRFLRHIERNPVLMILIPADSKNHREEYDILMNELEKYNPDLLDKEMLVTISKCDMLDEELKQEIVREFPSLVPIHFISSLSNIGISELKDKLWHLLIKDLEIE
jgi:GTP-binding protein